MNTKTRYIFLIIGTVLAIHFAATLLHSDYASATSYSSLKSHVFGGPITFTRPSVHLKTPLPTRRANATFVVLARNSDTKNMAWSMKQVEERFNQRFGYPYVFLNDEPFTEEFKTEMSRHTNSSIEFGIVPKEHWVQPDWIDERKAQNARLQMGVQKVIYGDSLSYRNMCRFNSGFFFKHSLLQQYRWYWRLEPDVDFYCDIVDDPFLYMEDNNKTYGWNINLYEFQNTIPTLWQHVKGFMKEHPQLIAANNSLNFLSDDGGETYNLCHFWSNFEIADMDFWRSPAYQAFFEYLDSKGGFYYERWGDAPIHSIAVSLLLDKAQLHFFNDIGYRHMSFKHCPVQDSVYTRGRCRCRKSVNFDYHSYSCMNRWDRNVNRTKPNWGD